MKILQISPECYPAAKAGGLGDVVGALPKYLNKIGQNTAVIIPKYQTKWLLNQSYSEVYRGAIRLFRGMVPFSIEYVNNNDLGYSLYVANIPGKFDRPGIYQAQDGTNFGDDIERWLCFQQAALHWIRMMDIKPSILHCHDHQTGLIPYFLKYSPDYKMMDFIPTVFTIHNGEYHGAYGWNKDHLLPYYDSNARGLLDWNDTINPLASAIRTCWRLTTVSPNYMEELRTYSNGLEGLIRSESIKSRGILNGIDVQVWDPSTDPFLPYQFGGDIKAYKTANKKSLLKRFYFNEDLPVFTFIGRLRREKGADLLPGLIRQVLNSGLDVAFLILGTGEASLHYEFEMIKRSYRGRFDVALEYNEGLAHQLYAGSDFLLMPSRVEPCGLNQMYAMRYGTIPVVRTAGGLKDTVIDLGTPDDTGRGFRFDQFSVVDAHHAVYRAYTLYHNKPYLDEVVRRVLAVDFSWENSTSEYLDVYNQLV